MRFDPNVEYLCYDDILLVPQHSDIDSRRSVDLSTLVGKLSLRLPIISANMDTVTGVAMARAMYEAGGIGCLHRFMSIDDNVAAWKRIVDAHYAIGSFGVGGLELERAKALKEAGCGYFCLDVANGAQESVVKQVRDFRRHFGSGPGLIVGNFATGDAIREMLGRVGETAIDAFKVGVGGGSACTTRLVSGMGVPTWSSVVDCARVGVDVIADGGIRSSADIAKALAAGARAVMVGRLLAGTTEAPGETVYSEALGCDVKMYRGSASADSYAAQGKVAPWRSPEGESYPVPFKGPVALVLTQLDAGLRGSLSSAGAHNLAEFQEKAVAIRISTRAQSESGAHGKTR